MTQLAPEEDELYFPVEVTIYKGGSTAGEVAATLESPHVFPGESWFLEASAPLAEGTYTLQATQKLNFEEGAPLVSAPVTFTEDQTPPAVSFAAPAAGSSTTAGSVPVTGAAGTASGDLPSVIVQAFAGGEAAGSPVEVVEVPSSGGSWSGALPGLSPGSYTLRAQQSDWAGNVGVSAPVPIVVVVPPAPLPPSPSFAWFPEVPRVGDTVTLVASWTATSAPVASFSWGLSATGPFHIGRSTTTTTFAAPGRTSCACRSPTRRGARALPQRPSMSATERSL